MRHAKKTHIQQNRHTKETCIQQKRHTKERHKKRTHIQQNRHTKKTHTKDTPACHKHARMTRYICFVDRVAAFL